MNGILRKLTAGAVLVAFALPATLGTGMHWLQPHVCVDGHGIHAFANSSHAASCHSDCAVSAHKSAHQGPTYRHPSATCGTEHGCRTGDGEVLGGEVLGGEVSGGEVSSFVAVLAPVRDASSPADLSTAHFCGICAFLALAKQSFVQGTGVTGPVPSCGPLFTSDCEAAPAVCLLARHTRGPPSA